MSDVVPELSTLRTAKMAMDEGLINQRDYDVVKGAFLKAHSIKAGLDAGFVEKDDYLEARRAFFESLRMTANGPATGKGVGSVARPAQPPAPPAAARAAAVPALNLATADTSAEQSPAAESSAALVQPAVQMNTYSSPRQAVPAAPPPSARGGASSVTANKKSMSGISVNQECIDLYNWVKAKKALRWITFKLDSSATQVVLDEQGEVCSTYADFLNVLPDMECRYAVYDYPYVNQDGESFSKLVFIAWSPSASTIKNKMMYASTKDFFKGFLEGMSVEVQATELEDLSEEEVRSAVATTVARK